MLKWNKPNYEEIKSLVCSLSQITTTTIVPHASMRKTVGQMKKYFNSSSMLVTAGLVS